MASGVRVKKARRGRYSRRGSVGDSARTFWKRGGASPRQQMESSPSGLLASCGLDFPEPRIENVPSKGSYFAVSVLLC